MGRHVVSLGQFGPLFHGSHESGLGMIDHTQATKSFSSGMPGGHSYANFTTTDMSTAINYARGNAEQAGPGHYPTVYEVESTNKRQENWEPDIHSGPGGYYDGPETKREALDLAENGSEVSLRHLVPLRVKREVFHERKAKDITPHDRSFT